jgi:hypothetical protein
MTTKSFKSSKLLNNLFNKLSFKLTKEEYDDLSQFDNISIKEFKRDDGEVIYSMVCHPYDESEVPFSKMKKFNLYEIKIAIEPYTFQKKRGHKITVRTLADLGEDKSETYNRKENTKKLLE